MKVLGIIVTALGLGLLGWLLFETITAGDAAEIANFLRAAVIAYPIAGATLLVGIFLWAAGVIEERLSQIRDGLAALKAKPGASTDSFLFGGERL